MIECRPSARRLQSASPRAVFVGLALLVMPGCPQNETLDAVPEDVAFIAVVTMRGDTVIETTPLQPADAAISAFASRDLTVSVIGYAAQPLSAWLDRAFDGATSAPTAAFRAPLRPAVDCDPPLPAPVWLSSNDGGTFSDRDPSTAPALTASWLEGQCPSVAATQIDVNIACDLNPCLQRRTALNPCRFEIDLDGCSQTPAEVVIWPDGAACIEPSPSRTCTEAEPDFGAAARLVCDGVSTLQRPYTDCLTEVYVTERPFLRPVVTATLTNQDDNFPRWQRDGFPIKTDRDLVRGPLIDLVVHDRQIAVLGLPQDRLPSADARCNSGTKPRALYLLAPDTLAIERVIPMPDCTVHLRADPAGEGYVYVYPDGGPGQWRVVQADLNGTVLRSNLLATTSSLARVQDLQPAIDGTARIFALIHFQQSNESVDADLLEIDVTTLETTGTQTVTGRFLSLATLPSGELLLGSSLQDNLELLRGPFTEPEEEREGFEFQTLGRGNLRLIDAAGSGNGRVAMFAISGDRPTFLAWPLSSPEPVGPLGANFQPGPVVTWAGRPGFVLVGGTMIEIGYRGILQAFDVEQARVVPGGVFLRAGVTDIGVHSNGDVYALLGWTSNVVRLTRTEPR